MSDVAIHVENLSKKYCIGHRQDNNTLRDTLTSAIYTPLRRLINGQSVMNNHQSTDTIWALKDVSFEVNQGEVVGIIGANGAGKSTLLKILTRITEPTEGYADIYGRVGSLLEVGTGFHSELTGRENIYLSGAILGMKKAEIDQKFDEIVSFSEIEKFLDTPVKHYSSGMYVRLAFAVAAHLEPEILIVDEVLAVGDSSFQRKCIAKMSDVATRQGRTVLFVSHNMTTIQALCERVFWLDKGGIVDQGSTQNVIQSYLLSSIVESDIPLDQRQDRAGSGDVRLTFVSVESANGDKVIYSDSRLKITIGYRSKTQVLHPRFVVSVYDSTSSSGVFRLDSDGLYGLPQCLPPEGYVTCITDPINLTPGRCFLNLRLQKDLLDVDYIQHAVFFDIEPEDIDGTGKCPERDWMLTVIKHRWSANGDRC